MVECPREYGHAVGVSGRLTAFIGKGRCDRSLHFVSFIVFEAEL